MGISLDEVTSPRAGRAELAVSRESLFMAVTDTTATIWTLEGIRR